MDELHNYQKVGASWLLEKPVRLLADDMGLGKTAQTITALDMLCAKRILILCPGVARFNWKREFDLFSIFPHNFKIILKTKDFGNCSSTDSIICSYDLAALHSDKIKGRFDVLILDECHFLKTVGAKRTAAVYGKKGLVRRATRVWALSGTPAPSHPGELWTLLFTFGVTSLTYERFIEKFCTYYTTHNRIQITGTRTESIPELKTMLKDIMLRRLKKDVLKELPPISYSSMVVEPGEVNLEMESSFIQYVFPNDRTEELFKKMHHERKMLDDIVEKAKLGKNAMAALEALASSVSTLRRYTGLQKVEATAKIIAQELEDNAYQKIVIFAVHRDVIEGLRNRLRKFDVVTLYGGHTPIKKQKNLDRFRNLKHCRVFIGNIQACGTAVSLTSAHHVTFIEQDWTPGNNAQAAMRCHRIGQEMPVFIRFIGLVNSLDQRIAQVLKIKTRDLTKIFDE